jgi:hypothetical protein
MRLPVRYTLGKDSGWGEILNIASGGALFTISQPVAIGRLVELCIGWPVMMHDNVHLNLVAEGAIVRVEEGRAAVRFEKREFRTCSSTFFRQAILPEFRDDESPER